MASQSRRRVFFDTNVLFSGIHSASGRPAELVGDAVAGRLIGVVSQEVLSELSRNLLRKAPHLLSRMGELVLGAYFEIVPDPPDQDIVRWRDAGFGTDAPIVAAAILASVDYFCTGDRRLPGKAALIEKAGPRAVTPTEMAGILTLENP